MKIGLIRHFQVAYPCKAFTLMSSGEFKEWQDGYNIAKIKQNHVDIDKSQWQICYSSDLSRAMHTAQAVYDNEIIQTKSLREVEILPLFKTNIKFPFILWNILGRFAWYFSHKHIDEKRAYDFIFNILIEDKNDILIVSHGALMWYLRKALLSKGFSGPSFTKAKNGYLYIFEK